jgi:acyl-CoA synthetase (NDP forming)
MRDKNLVKDKMESLWHPKSVAMIGATNKMGKWGFIILSRMLNEGFKGNIYPVNPKDDMVLGKKAYKSLDEIPGKVDLAIIVTPAVTVPTVIRQVAKKKIPAVITITSGFSEVGPEGVKIEGEIVDFVRKNKMIMVGPNTMGICSTAVNLNCLMAPISPMAGGASCIAQSGNVGTHMLFRGKVRGLGYNKFVSSGNEGDLAFEDYLAYFGDDPETTTVVGYVEGLDPSSRFMEIAPQVTAKKPVITLKGGRTGAGAIAASSHTGALAGNVDIYRGAMRQAGVIMAESNKEVVELARALEMLPVPKGPRVGILTRGGGWGVITSDACNETGLLLPALSDKTIASLDKILPPYWSRGNPVDMVAVLDSQSYLDCLDIVVQDPNVDSVIALGANIDAQGIKSIDALRNIGVMSEKEAEESMEKLKGSSAEFIEGLRDYIQGSDKPVLTVGRWREKPDWEFGLMMIQEPEDAARMLSKMVEYGNYLKRTGVF